ncbi:tRNA(His) guanylyltransferase Thg1 family protein [Actinoplanes sp. G11-F43]|uniref:tRNA(His) guanylyltransferase Thg1 family protein n=1 Tax=Actinoplanes sp. G11-F43 TaxID=3424130 RepID=UPI003D350BE8
MGALSGARYAYTVSDEISLLFDPGFWMFGRKLEKLVSVSAGLASAGFTLESGILGHFDSRVWIGATVEDVADYFQWRQADAGRSALHGWCYWTLRQDGATRQRATEALSGLSTAGKNELLHRSGVNFSAVPAWQRRGIGLWGDRVEWELPMRREYRELVVRLAGWRAESTIGA